MVERAAPSEAAFFVRTQKLRSQDRTERLTRTLKVFLLLLCASIPASAQLPKENPVAQVRENRAGRWGRLRTRGTGLGDRDQFRFFAAGFQIGKAITPVLHAGILSGQFELAGNIQPFWQAYTPDPHVESFVYQGCNL